MIDNRNNTADPVERPLRASNGHFAKGNDFGKKSRKRPKGALGWLKILRQKTTQEDFEEVVDQILATAKGETDHDPLGAQRLLFKYLIPPGMLAKQTELEHQLEIGEVSALEDPWLVKRLGEILGEGP